MSDAPFAYKLKLLFEPRRYKVLWGGRSAGRSWGCSRALLLLGTSKPIRVLCAREYQNSISESVHKVLSDQIDKLGLGYFYEIQSGRILGRNGTSFTFEGIKNNTTRIKSYEGIDYCWVEEANKVSKASWNILIPTIRKAGSEIWITFNPELETDYTYQHFVRSPPGEPKPGWLEHFDPEWPSADREGIVVTSDAFVIKMNYKDNPWLSPETKMEIEDLKKRDYDTYLNVWEGFCLQTLEGVVYARELRKAQLDGRICSVPYEPTIPVDTYWDLGRADNTAIWFSQNVAMQKRVLRYFEANSMDIPVDDPTGGVQYFLKELQKFGYVYGTMYLPHDAKAKRLGTKRSIEEMIRAAGYRVQIVPRLSLVDGINAARLVFPNCWFDEDDCADGLQALRHYKYKVVEGQLSKEPLHDWASDGADAFRYLAVAAKSGAAKSGLAAIAERFGFGGGPAGPPEKSRLGSSGNGLGWMG